MSFSNQIANKNMQQNWFIAELIFHNHGTEQSRVVDVEHVFNKQMRMFSAENVRAAFQHALVLASKELDIINSECHQWEFAAIGLLQTMEHPLIGLDRMTLHYTLENDNDANLHMVSLRLRQNSLLNQIAISA